MGARSPHEDLRALLERWHTALAARDLLLCGVTTDGAARAPEPLREVCGEVLHQRCQLPIVAEVVQAVLGAVARARKGLAAMQPTRPKGRPRTPAAKAAARTQTRLAAPRADLGTPRSLFGPHPLNTTARKTLGRLTRDLPQWRTLRDLMEQVYAWVDRRCRTQTALAKLAKLRRRLLRFPR